MAIKKTKSGIPIGCPHNNIQDIAAYRQKWVSSQNGRKLKSINIKSYTPTLVEYAVEQVFWDYVANHLELDTKKYKVIRDATEIVAYPETDKNGKTIWMFNADYLDEINKEITRKKIFAKGTVGVMKGHGIHLKQTNTIQEEIGSIYIDEIDKLVDDGISRGKAKSYVEENIAYSDKNGLYHINKNMIDLLKTYLQERKTWIPSSKKTTLNNMLGLSFTQNKYENIMQRMNNTFKDSTDTDVHQILRRQHNTKGNICWAIKEEHVFQLENFAEDPRKDTWLSLPELAEELSLSEDRITRLTTELNTHLDNLEKHISPEWRKQNIKAQLPNSNGTLTYINPQTTHLLCAMRKPASKREAIASLRKEAQKGGADAVKAYVLGGGTGTMTDIQEASEESTGHSL